MSIRLLCIGDVMLGENLNHYKRSIRTKFQPNYKQLIPQALSTYISENVDLIFYNFEYSLSEQSGFLNKKAIENVYKGTPETLTLFEGNKIAVNIANNHFAEHGPEVCDFTKGLLRKNGIAIIGETPEPTIINLNNVLLYFFGVTLVKDKHSNSEYFKADYETLLGSLKLPEKKAANEHWVISVHWGDEYLDSPSQQQQFLGKALVDKGFDLIIGHHPHTLQPIEFYKDKLIIYSLGNFIFDQNFSRRTQTGLVLNILLNDRPTVLNSFLSRQKKYIITELKEVSVNKINRIPPPTFYSVKKKFFSYWYRLLMKLEVALNYRELDKETIEDYTGKLKKKFGIKGKNS